MNHLFFDLEGFPFGSEHGYAPPIVCCQFAWAGSDPHIENKRDAKHVISNALTDSTLTWVGLNIAYDMACVISNWPEFTSQVFQLYEDRRVIDIGVYEKFIMLAKHGYVDSREGEEGKKERLRYSLAAIAFRRLGITLTGKDEEDETTWRKNFQTLDGWEVKDYPREAAEYALDDVRVLPTLLHSQLAENVDFRAAPLTTAAAFGLYLMKCTGVDIDPVERSRVEAWIQSELTDERLEPLYLSRILRRPEPPRAYKNGNGTTQGKKSSVDTKVLRAIITDVATRAEVPIRMTEGGKEGLNPQVSTSDEFLQEIEHHDERLAAYAHRQRLAKIFSTELPRIQVPRVHPNYDALKETGRTSSFQPNIQNVDPRMRGCYVPPKGGLFISVDYSAIELVTLAQKLIWLFGRSTLGDLINEGKCPHAYLGARLAWEFDRENFSPDDTSPMGLYEAFSALKKGTEEQQAYYTHWRTFAKPVGLGYPGGLGPDTFVVFAKGTYGVIVTRAQAVQLREIWRETFPEMLDYFDWIKTQCATGQEDYAYVSPAGMLRNHCSYCACANGAALQTPAAEGAKLALWEVVRKCFDPAKQSLLYGCRPWGFIHDQLLISAPNDGFCHERAGEIQSDMVSSMKQVIPDVAVRTEACLMSRWDKGAKPKFDSEGRLIPWN